VPDGAASVRADAPSALAPLPASARAIGAPASSATGATTRAGAIRVLLAEDNALNAALTLAMLKLFGCDVIHASDGREAVHAASTQAFDVMLLDAHMPALDGPAVLDSIRSEAAARRLNGDTPAIVVTADAVDNARGRFLAAGFDDYVAKPFLYDQLRSVVEQWARRRRSPGTGGTGN
jgi:CheY-like chemotaxis protein